MSVTEAIDTTTPTGRFTFTVLAAVAQLERDLISERTKDALAELRARRGSCLGRRRRTTRMVGAVMWWKDEDHRSFTEIAQRLNKAGHRTSTGAAWTHVQVKRVWMRAKSAEVRNA